ncbi:MAG: adenylate/guanylate cyclase domain-containing protein, partial [Candidatus Rokuibacteriota bacterium]
MGGRSIERRLAAILSADVEGYSRLMGDDEVATVRAITEYRAVIASTVTGHGGRVVDAPGDNVLAEFSSVVDAVQCAVDIQRQLEARNAELPPSRRMRFRIGINLGDVIIEGERLYGDGVNIAARLEALAEPNGICISQTVYEQVRDKLPYPFEDLGHQNVKNIARPLHAFALRSAVIAALPLSDAVRLRHEVTSGPLPGRAPRLSIVVLPFANLSNDRDQQYLADGMTDDVTTDLSRIAGMVVISRNTAFTYRDKPIDTKQIGRELSVRYVLQGSVRRAGSQVRVNTQLIDAETDAHIWAERFDYATDDLFALQDDVTSRIAVALNLELPAAEAARPADHPDGLDYILRGRAALHRGSAPEGFSEAIRLFDNALAVDPVSIEGRTLLARALIGR